ncbi:hypothetical protein PCC82_21030 [Agrobacterium deltaense]
MLAIVTFPQSAAKATPPEKAKPAERIVAPKSIFIFVPSGRGVAETRVRTAPRPSAFVLRLNNSFVVVPFAAISGVLRMAIVNRSSRLPGASVKFAAWGCRFPAALPVMHAVIFVAAGTYPESEKAGNNKTKFLFSWTFIPFCITGNFVSFFVVILNDQFSCCPGMADRWR